MLVSLNWLKEFVETELSAEEIAELLTMGGIEVEAIDHVGGGLQDVLTAKIEKITPHPSSDKLSLAHISLGKKKLQVVCGAPNISVGQIVPYVGPGAVLPSGEKIEEKQIKGVSSPGMLCSEKELGLGDDASGILLLEPDTAVGLPLPQALPFIEDFILTTAVTPNRGDCLSILGTAREVAALADKKWALPEVGRQETSGDINKELSVEVPDADLCPRYVATMVEGVTIGPSPFDVRLRLSRSGMRPISNVVDATNLLLLECGQPLHAFDYEFLEDRKIVVRRADPGQTFVTLDDVERKLPNNALMICDGRKPVALAGIMGGLNSEINPETTSVVIESACFERFGVRRTSKAMGLSTEASYRFERGVDPVGSLWTAHRAAELIQRLAGGKILSGHIDVYPTPIERPAVRIRPVKVNSLLGISLSTTQIAAYLNRLGIETEQTNDAEGALNAQPPAWRWDLEREADFSEEVARIHGFQNIPLSMIRYTAAPDRTRQNHRIIRKVNELMNASGFTEVITMSFVSGSAAQEFITRTDENRSLSIVNPLTEDFAAMRTSLLPGLLSVMKRNRSFRRDDLKLYEIGKTFIPVENQELPREDLRLAGLATGARYHELWNLPKGEEIDFYDVKGALENLFEGLNIEEAQFVPSEIAFLHPNKCAELVSEGEKIGFIGELAPFKIRELDLMENIYVFEILLEPLFIRIRKETVFRPLPRYPFIERDLSFIVEEKCSGERIKQLISRLGHDIIASVILFDIYRGESIPEGQKSIALRIRYQSEDRTLTDEEVQEVHSQVATILVKELGSAMRE
jgi:phenylalanyl-tRNA synthetase beta chain